jgi:RNA-directed DNA polymerase
MRFALRVSLEEQFAECRLTLHPEKTKIVYCKDDDRRKMYLDQKFDLLGYTFRPRLSRRRRGTFGVSFSPAASDKVLEAIRQTLRGWALQERSDKTLEDLARMFYATIRGWINY